MRHENYLQGAEELSTSRDADRYSVKYMEEYFDRIYVVEKLEYQAEFVLGLQQLLR